MEWDLASLRAVRSSTRENQSNERADNCRQANVEMQLFHLLPLGSIRPWRTRKKGGDSPTRAVAQYGGESGGRMSVFRPEGRAVRRSPQRKEMEVDTLT
jgi:hypothetical protein